MEVFQFLMPIFTEYGYLAVFVMLLICGFGVPIPEDVTLVTGGVIAGLGHADVHTMFAVGMAGVLVGDGLMFILGRLYGQRISQLPGFRKVLTPARFASAQEAFQKYGKWVMFVARFLPGLRTPVFFSAGMSHRVSFGTWVISVRKTGTGCLACCASFNTVFLCCWAWAWLGWLGAGGASALVQRAHPTSCPDPTFSHGQTSPSKFGHCGAAVQCFGLGRVLVAL
jgi:membrane protein DedA with SNARE-associated domain